MKKLMIALGAIALAAGVQAANVTWGFGGAVWLSTDGTSSTKFKTADDATKAAFANTQLVLLNIGADTTFDTSTVASKISSGDYTVLGTSDFAASTSTSKWNPATQASSLGDSAVGDNLAILIYDGSAYDYLYAVNTTSGAVGAEKNASLASLVQGNLDGTVSLSIYGMGGSTTQGAIVAAVPEPTSGLLLLGIGAMALRRRRA